MRGKEEKGKDRGEFGLMKGKEESSVRPRAKTLSMDLIFYRRLSLIAYLSEY